MTSNFSTGVLQAYNIPNVQPTGNSIRRQAAFTHVGAGGDYTHPSQEFQGVSWYAGGDARERHYHNNAVFDYQQFDWRTGFTFANERDSLKLGAQGSRYYQEGAAPSNPDGTAINNDRRSIGPAVEWRRVLSANSQVAAFAQLNEQRFQTNNIQDFNQKLYGAQYLRAFEARWKPVALVMAFASRDRALRPLNAAGTSDASKSIIGYRMYAQVTPVSAADAFVSVGHTEREDDSQFSRSSVVGYGKDRTVDITLGANWRFQPSWTLRAQATHTDGRSNIPLFSFTRNELSVNVRRDFQ